MFILLCFRIVNKYMSMLLVLFLLHSQLEPKNFNMPSFQGSSLSILSSDLPLQPRKAQIPLSLSSWLCSFQKRASVRELPRQPQRYHCAIFVPGSMCAGGNFLGKAECKETVIIPTLNWGILNIPESIFRIRQHSKHRGANYLPTPTQERDLSLGKLPSLSLVLSQSLSKCCWNWKAFLNGKAPQPSH